MLRSDPSINAPIEIPSLEFRSEIFVSTLIEVYQTIENLTNDKGTINFF